MSATRWAAAAPGWGAVFAAIFFGLALGMFLGLRVLRGFSRRRLFGVSIMFAALPLAIIALIPNLVLVVILTIVLGACAGVAYVTGYTVDRPRGGRRHPRAYVRVPAVGDPGDPLCRDRDRADSRGRLQRAGARDGRCDLRIGDVAYLNIGYNLVLLLAAAVALVLGRAVLPADGRPPGRAAAGRPGLGVPARPEAQRRTGTRTACTSPRRWLWPPSGGPACSWRWRAARAPASRRRPGCWRSGCATRATTS